MLYRNNAEGYIAISQPSHAWLAGQIARAWGNSEFGSFEPWEEVCLGAEVHDIGWLPWEASPTLNPQTGRPHNFTEVPVKAHTALWSAGVQMALALGHYPALLVSLHGVGIYQQFNNEQASAEAAQTVDRFIAQQQALQSELLKTLRQDARYAAFCQPKIVERNRQIVRVADRLSLAICMEVKAAFTLENVPTANGKTVLKLEPMDNTSRLVVSPWPFKAGEVSLVCEGRHLSGSFTDEQVMQETLRQAPRATVEATLYPA